MYTDRVRVECEHCRELVEPAWSVDGAEVRARCPRCGGASAITVDTEPASDAAVAAATDGCPKCGLAPVTGDACARCGLARERMAAWADGETPAPALAEAWDACLAAWSDAAVHERAASVALTVGEQPWLARRYRAILRERPGDAVARARLTRLGRIAQAAVLATAATPRASRFKKGSAYAVLAVLVLALVGGMLLTMYLVQKNRQDPDPPAPAGATRVRATPVSPKDAPWQRPELRDQQPRNPPRVESGPPRQ